MYQLSAGKVEKYNVKHALYVYDFQILPHITNLYFAVITMIHLMFIATSLFQLLICDINLKYVFSEHVFCYYVSCAAGHGSSPIQQLIYIQLLNKNTTTTDLNIIYEHCLKKICANILKITSSF